ncbi:lantibiotic dehydratase [Sphaerisporangium sp. NPDC051011]|uniref:lantibiotic dehydratase n=1 Tax=Sphaerisporangium sp. NPDC051011 TaxID=3155792 RepID=UPI0033E649CB
MTAFRMLDSFVLRRAGFALSLIAGLGCPRTAAALREAHKWDECAEAVRSELLGQAIPAEVTRFREAGDKASLRALSRLRSRLGRRTRAELPPGDWSPALAAAHMAWDAALDAAERETALGGKLLAEEEPEAAARLLALTGRGDVREAIFLLSPDFLESLLRRDLRGDADSDGARTARDRALERRVYAFLQRLAAKNETTSFFGPSCFGRVDAEAEAVGRSPETPTGVVHREAFFAFWAAAAWGKAAAAVPAIRRHLPPRRLPVVVIEDTRATIPGRPPVELDATAVALLRAADGTRTPAELAAGLGISPEEAARRIAVLERALLLRRDLEPSSTTVHPLRDVVSRLPDVPEARRFTSAAADMAALLERFAEETAVPQRTKLLAAAEELFESVTGVPARRNQGRTYTDRFVLFEDCRADDEPLIWPAAVARRVENVLDPVLRLGLTAGRIQRDGLRAIAAEVLAANGGSMPFLEFADALAARLGQGAFEPVLDVWGRWRDTLLDRFLAASDGRMAHLASYEVEDLADPPEGSYFVSPDVMLQGDDDAPLVLGEIHPYVFAWGLQGVFAPDPARLAADIAPVLDVWGGIAHAATVLHRRRHKGLVGEAYPGRFIEVAGRAGVGPERRLAVGDLRAVLRDGEPELVGPHGPISLYVGEDDHPHLRVFAPVPVDFPRLRTGGHTPRLVLGDLVVQRERWDLPAGAPAGIVAAEGRLELFRAVVAERERRGWPRHVFALSPTETKPVYLDLDVPQAQEQLRLLAAAGPLAVSEMLPGPGRLWLHRSGGAHTSEFRVALVGHVQATP